MEHVVISIRIHTQLPIVLCDSYINGMIFVAQVLKSNLKHL